MRASYDDQAFRFDDANARLVTAGLDDRHEGSEHTHLLAALEDVSADSFLPGTRDRVMASLRTSSDAGAALAALPRVARSHPYIIAGSDEQILPDMPVKDRIVYRAAEDKLLAREADGALATLSPSSPRNAPDEALTSPTMSETRCGQHVVHFFREHSELSAAVGAGGLSPAAWGNRHVGENARAYFLLRLTRYRRGETPYFALN